MGGDTGCVCVWGGGVVVVWVGWVYLVVSSAAGEWRVIVGHREHPERAEHKNDPSSESWKQSH